ncbi:sporulation integral membrane protein YtvI [Sediminibacillus massiliensis]|uniref:sporulation integral membrane protein YtvI n=1 Tax=Sediminibacillus massiliensis TaxID=1926277 RepID=UPI0009885979|nr:sporulation integral membrane protein YtvI [Sediminibacillus massiliensis]
MPLTTFHQLLRAILVILAFTAGLVIFYYVAGYIYPFLLALILAFLLNPLVDFFENKGYMPRAMAVILVLFWSLFVIIGIFTLILIELINGTTYLAEMIPHHFKTLVSFIEAFITTQVIPLYDHLLSLIKTLEPAQQQLILQHIKKVGQDISENGAELLQTILQAIPNTIIGLPNFVSVLLFSLLGTFFISKDWYKLRKYYFQFAPPFFTKSVSEILAGLNNAFLGFIKAQLTLIFITFIIVLCGLFILGIEHTLTIAAIIAVIDLLPYLGTGLIFLPWICYSFFSGEHDLTIGISILYAIIIIQRQIMEPKVLSDNMGLHPLATLIALFAGFQLFGFWGLIIGPALLVIGMTVVQSGIITHIWLYIVGNNQK